MESRRKFIKQTLLGLGGVALASTPIDLFAKNKKSKKLTILHTNDMHSWIEPYNKGENKGIGGMAQRAALINKIRSEENNVLLLDAGDVFQGTPYFNFFGGELEFKLMSKMKYDVATLGNHDFDNGLSGLKKMLPHAEFPFINANYDFSNTVLEGQFKPYKVFDKGGIKIGVFGVGIEMEGLIAGKNYLETKWNNPYEISKDMVKTLRETENCDYIICLSHLGLKYNSNPQRISDVNLAKTVDGIDLIIGGHTHSFLDKPIMQQSPSGKDVIINQVGWAGINLGRIDVEFGYQQKPKMVEGSALKIVDNLWKTT